MHHRRCGRRGCCDGADRLNLRVGKVNWRQLVLASTLVQPNGPRLIVEPDDGLGPVLEFIASARTSLLIKQFTLTDESLIDAVIERKRAGVDVRVMLNAARSGGDRANDETFERFRAAGIAVQWASPKFYVTHEKSVVVDETAALVATFNMCLKYFTLTRDYGVIIDDPLHVAQIVEVFNADWNHEDWVPPAVRGSAVEQLELAPAHGPLHRHAPRIASTFSTPSSSTRSSSTTSRPPSTGA